MNDFDFEELDKAVTKLASKTQTENNLPQSSRPVPIAITPAAARQTPGAQRPSVADRPLNRSAEAGPAIAPAASSTPAPTPIIQHPQRLGTVQPKRRGAFMDIVAPSKTANRHNTKTLEPVSGPEAIAPESQTPTPLSEPSAKPADRPAFATIQERAPELMAELSEPKEPQSPPPTPEKSKPKAPTQSDDLKWPDPLDFQDLDDTSDKPKSEPEQEESPKSEASTQTSPFLPEAKVEKRPLGAFSNFESKPEPTEAKTISAAGQDELTPESDGTFKEPKAPTMHEANTEEKSKKAAKRKDQSAASEPNEPAKPDMHSQAMLSIPSQYHAKSKPTDTSTRPVFDTKEYHPPLIEATAGEHRGGGSIWSKLFIALVVLALLGVGGYFAYLYLAQQ